MKQKIVLSQPPLLNQSFIPPQLTKARLYVPAIIFLKMVRGGRVGEEDEERKIKNEINWISFCESLVGQES